MIICAYIALSLFIFYSIIVAMLGLFSESSTGCLMIPVSLINIILAIIGIVGIALR